jgi:uncharacterized membrane protein
VFAYVHALIYGAWDCNNLGWVPRVPGRWRRIDSTFVVLAMVASVEAILSVHVHPDHQQRMTALADRRAMLDLQISLLTEPTR